MTNILSQNKKWLLPIGLIVITYLAVEFIRSNPPETKRRGPSQAPQMTVEASIIKAQPYQIVIDSYGTVKPRTQSALVSQVSGQIMSIDDNFREGGFFKKGDVLVKLDDRDYQAEVKVAQAGLLSAQQTLLEEQARAEQARIDWQRLGNNAEPSDLVLRKPQLAAAQAKALSAEAQLQKAELALERTHIRAPYDGRILSKAVDVGQVISMNTKVAEIYATDYVEVRLPIKNKDLDLLDLPEQGRNLAPDVLLKSDLVGKQAWQGQLVRTEGAIDQSSQQLYVVAQINEPYSETNQQTDQMPIKIGQYVSAQIKGVVLSNALVIPNNTIYQGSFVYLVEDGQLKRSDVEIKWQNSDVAVIASGLNDGDRIVTSPLGQVSSGTRVSVYGEGAQREGMKKRRGEFGQGKGMKERQGKRPNGKRMEGKRPEGQSGENKRSAQGDQS